MVSQAYKDLIDAGVWASGDDAERETPEEAGLVRDEGWPLAYEQPGTGFEPERTVFNQRDHETDAALVDIAATGIPAWDAAVNYTPTSDAHCFVTTSTGVHVTDQNTGPAYGNATDPDATNQDIWRRY